jgi:alkanesulfonate monooxygenase SsuD/methylene tetrahydromethanopterin reductase-like flavin-dependent oxidoreductase (luciferase family)
MAGRLHTNRRSVRIGLHTPLQHAAVGELARLWAGAENAGYDWISVWDHLAALDGTTANLEAVAMHAALACRTSRARCACLVYAVGHRSPLVLAAAAATVDHLSGGRAVLGLGTGYVAREHEAHGRPLLDPAGRSSHLEEVVQAVRRLLDGEEVTVEGEHVRLDRARCAPVPVQAHLPIVIGGGGERRTIPLAARVADGWNVPMATPADAARKIALLREHEAAAGRTPGTVEAILSVGLCRDAAQLPARFGARWEILAPAVLSGSTQQVLDHAAQYVAAGADRLVVSVRAPLDDAVADEVAWFASDVAPELR